jgi:hypothetical protein
VYPSLLVAFSMLFSVAQQPNSCLGHLIFRVSRLHTHTRTHAHPVGLLWTNDQLVAEAAIYTKYEHPWPQRDSNPRFQHFFLSTFLSFCCFFNPLCTFIFSVFMLFVPLRFTTRTSMHPAGFEPTAPTSERTHGAATGICRFAVRCTQIIKTGSWESD